MPGFKEIFRKGGPSTYLENTLLLFKNVICKFFDLEFDMCRGQFQEKNVTFLDFSKNATE